MAPGLMKNTNAPSMASTAAPTKNGRIGWVKKVCHLSINVELYYNATYRKEKLRYFRISVTLVSFLCYHLRYLHNGEY